MPKATGGFIYDDVFCPVKAGNITPRQRATLAYGALELRGLGNTRLRADNAGNVLQAKAEKNRINGYKMAILEKHSKTITKPL